MPADLSRVFPLTADLTFKEEKVSHACIIQVLAFFGKRRDWYLIWIGLDSGWIFQAKYRIDFFRTILCRKDSGIKQGSIHTIHGHKRKPQPPTPTPVMAEKPRNYSYTLINSCTWAQGLVGVGGEVKDFWWLWGTLAWCGGVIWNHGTLPPPLLPKEQKWSFPYKLQGSSKCHSEARAEKTFVREPKT